MCDREEGESLALVLVKVVTACYCWAQPCTGGTVVPRLQERAPFGTGSGRRGSKVHPSVYFVKFVLALNFLYLQLQTPLHLETQSQEVTLISSPVLLTRVYTIEHVSLCVH